MVEHISVSTLVQGLVLFPGWTGANGVITEGGHGSVLNRDSLGYLKKIVGYTNTANATSSSGLEGDWKGAFLFQAGLARDSILRQQS
jgi:hypothetical protein